jgi:hypothetical protein
MSLEAKRKAFLSYAKSYKRELELINNTLATGYYQGTRRKNLLNRKYNIMKRLESYTNYLLKVL